jgi:hypothetical protein
MLRIYSAAALLAIAGAGFAQTSTAPGTPPSTIPSTTPGTPPASSQTPSVTPSQTPAVTPSQTPSVTPSQAPSVGSTPNPVVPPQAVGGLSKCENMIGTDKDACQQQEHAGTGGTMRAPAAPAGSIGTVR